MKRILLVLLVLFGLQTQAQITLCDTNMTYTTGSQMQLEVAIPVTGNNLPMMAPLYAVTYGDGNMLSEDSCFSGPCTHMIYNYNPNGTYYDTLTTCISYIVTDTMSYVDTLMCCFEQYWDGQFWQKVLMQQPNFTCDSLSYSIVVDSSNWNTLTVTGNMNGLSLNMIDSMDWNFTACNTSTCYTAQGNNPYSFPSILVTDTVKLCYDAFVYSMGNVYICTECDSLVYDFMTDAWVLMSMGNPVGITELIVDRINDGIMYDLMGRKLVEVNVGQMYIRNNKKFIRVK
jgi:hypothetical protein